MSRPMPACSIQDRSSPVLGHGVYGQGREKVLVLHDWMGDSANYLPLIPYLDFEHFTYAFADVRGYGKSLQLEGDYTADEIAADAFALADSLDWTRFHVVGHSMTGMAVQRMALEDAISSTRRLKSIVAITPVAANGYPADEATKRFLWELIHERGLSEKGFSLLTGQRLTPAWGRAKTERHLQTSSAAALRGYYRMWLETDFSRSVRDARIATPMLVIGGRQDLPGFQEEHLRKTFGAWYPHVEIVIITDAGHYPMQETPVYLASLVEHFLNAHRQVAAPPMKSSADGESLAPPFV